MPYLENELQVDENTVIVGWSSGAVAALRFAEKHQLAGSVLIGVSHTDLNDEGEKISGYFNEPWEWEAIKKNQKWIVQLASLDDPCVPIEEGCFVHEKLDTEYYEFFDRKHFGFPNATPTFQEVVDVIFSKIHG